MKLYRIAHVQILVIPAAPVEGFSLLPPETFQVHPAPGKDRQILLRKILADNPHDLYRRKKTRRHGKIGCRSSQDALGRPERGLYGVKGYGSNHQNTHLINPKSKIQNPKSKIL